MKASFNWLRALVPTLPNDPREVAGRLARGGIEVETMRTFGDGAEKCIIARVTALRAHPARTGLRLVTVDLGAVGAIEVVCGAANVPDPGGLVVFAPLGTTLPAKGMTIGRREIGGIVSEGMLCSEAELGVSNESDGIIVLPAELAAPGARFIDAVPSAHDTIFELGVTPNRPDALGHIGLARDIAALSSIDWTPPPLKSALLAHGKQATSEVTVRIEDAEGCPHYAATIVEAVTIEPSPLWLQHRLTSLGIRPISNVVDMTNLMLMLYGHPLHAFDFDRVSDATIVVRRAREGERLTTLDGVERTLSTDDLVICDTKAPIALAGVMGGAASEVTSLTKRVLIECAYFDPRVIRRAARRHAIHSEGSHRFERGIDSGDTMRVLTDVTAGVVELTRGHAVPGATLVVAKEIRQPSVRLRNARISQLLGFDIPAAEVATSLRRLGFVKLSGDAESSTFVVPTFRPDVSREVDLIEEAVRLHGFDAIPRAMPTVLAIQGPPGRETFLRRVRDAAVTFGLYEALTYSFVSPEQLEAVGAPAPTVILKNPMNDQRSVMRTSLLPGLFESLSRARRHGERDVRLFSVGTLFGEAPAGQLPLETSHFSALLAGDRPSYLQHAEPVDAWDAKGLAIGMLAKLTKRSADVVTYTADKRPLYLHPRAAGEVRVDGVAVGRIGLLHPDVAAKFDVGNDTVVVELNLQTIADLPKKAERIAHLPKFPASTRDLALVLSDDIPAGDVLANIVASAGDLGESVSIFDRFVGKGIPADHASVAFRVVYRASNRTLTDAEIDARHAAVVAAAQSRFGAQLRS